MSQKPSIAEIERSLIEDFDLLEDVEEKIEYLVDLGHEMQKMDPALKTEDRLVKGCQSSVWFDIHCENGLMRFSADSDSLVVKGLVAILDKLLNGQPAEEVLKMDLSLFEKLGLWHHISSQRSSGLAAMMGHLKQAAVECLGE